jgi:hypothetical protein
MTSRLVSFQSQVVPSEVGQGVKGGFLGILADTTPTAVPSGAAA